MHSRDELRRKTGYRQKERRLVRRGIKTLRQDNRRQKTGWEDEEEDIDQEPDNES